MGPLEKIIIVKKISAYIFLSANLLAKKPREIRGAFLKSLECFIIWPYIYKRPNNKTTRTFL